jgi:hypothetical protein
VRYIPGKPLLRAQSGRGTIGDTDQVRDASRITPPRIDELHPDAAYFSIEGRLSAADVEIRTLSSPTHGVLIRQEGDSLAIELSARSTVPDRDFVLAWQEPITRQLSSRGWRWQEGSYTYGLVQLRAPHDVKADTGVSQDFYFLLDRSSSMAGEKWVKSCMALHGFVKLLGPDDRVWITVFESTFQDFDAVPMRAPEVLTDTGFQQMQALGTTGGTELLPAASHVLRQIAVHSKDRRASVILITDGQVGNEGEVLCEFSKTPRISVHTFGIDTAVNDAFLKSLARQHRGGCWLQTPNDDIAGTVAALGDRLRRPVLDRLAVRGAWEVASEIVPDIHAREVVTVALRGKSGATIEVAGTAPDGSTRTITVQLDDTANEAVKHLWARERIAVLLAAKRSQEAIDLAKAHNILCEGAAFVAWHEHQQVVVATEELVQPVMMGNMVMRDRMQPPNALFCCYASDSRDFSRDFSGGQSSDASLFRMRSPDPDDTRPGKLLDRLLSFLRAGGTDTLDDAAVDRFATPIREAGVPPANARVLIKWAIAEDSLNRTQRLEDALSRIQTFRQQFGKLLETDRSLDQALAGTVEAMEQWLQDCTAMSPALHRLKQWERKLGENLMERIARWLAQHGRLDPHRLDTILAMLEAIPQTGFSAASTQSQCHKWLDHQETLALPAAMS